MTTDINTNTMTTDISTNTNTTTNDTDTDTMTTDTNANANTNTNTNTMKTDTNTMTSSSPTVWVMHGKTQYLALLLEEKEEKALIRWDCNREEEWVLVDHVEKNMPQRGGRGRLASKIVKTEDLADNLVPAKGKANPAPHRRKKGGSSTPPAVRTKKKVKHKSDKPSSPSSTNRHLVTPSSRKNSTLIDASLINMFLELDFIPSSEDGGEVEAMELSVQEGVTPSKRTQKEHDVHDDDSSGLFSKSDNEEDMQKQETVEDDDSSGLFSRSDDELEVQDKAMSVNGDDDSSGLFSDEDEVEVERIDHGVTFPAPIIKPKRGSCVRFKPLEVSCKPLLVLSESTDHFFLRLLWDGKLIVKNTKLPSKNPLDVSFEHGGTTYSIVAVKYEKRTSNGPMKRESDHGAAGYAKAYYVAMDHWELQESLNRLGNFAALQPPCKVAKRLELLVSPASKELSGTPRVWLRKQVDFELIEENFHLGCGFIPVEFLAKLVGTPEIAAIQVRIYSSSLGHFKGMLMAKTQITRIQLPKSMLKVEASLENNRLDTDVFLVCKGIFPSKPSKMVDRHLNPTLKDPPRSAEKQLYELSGMVKNLMVLAGVPRETVDRFGKDASEDWNRKHWAFCVGVADPTGCLPEGSVFVTGVGVGYDTSDDQHQMFITRCPCTELSDGKLLPVVSHKPAAMKRDDWKHLCSIHFGLVIFATPTTPHGRSLPEQIADGDLDGDLYFLCWDREILSHMSPERFLKTPNNAAVAEDDPLVGQSVTTTVEGKVICGESVRKHEGEGYVCNFGANGEIVLTRAEVLGDRDFMVRIHEHRGIGMKAQVLIEWELAGSTKWEPVNRYRNDEANAQIIADYALSQGLLETRGWEWTQSYIRPLELVTIHEHGTQGGSLQVLVTWDNGDEEWESVLELSQNEVYDNREKLARYAQENNLLRKKGWAWAEKHLKERSGKWLEPVQRYMADMDRLMEQSRLTEALHGAYRKSLDSGEASEQDTDALGRAFKQSIDITKHGGMVDLPLYQQKQLKKKKLMKYMRF